MNDEVLSMHSVEKFGPNLERIRRDIVSLSNFTSATETGYTRISFSEEDREARRHVSQLMESEAKLQVRIDAAGNLIGRREGKKKGPAILMGSHIDTVRGGGRFDGVSGVIAALEVLRRFEEKGVETPLPMEVVVFLAEEPSPFGISTVGSRGVAGKLSEEILASLKDDQGRTLGMAIREMGGDPARIDEAKRSSDDVLAYLELHIEQGPFLFTQGIPIGVVTGIVGISRGKIEVIGSSDHPGTTPMGGRKDALVAGSEVILALERVCKGLGGVVGTIGRIEVYPNSLNVIPGTVTLGMEIRSLREALLGQAISLFKAELDQVANKRGIVINLETVVTMKPTIFTAGMVDRIVWICERHNIPYVKIASGAGHDATHMAEIVPTGMIFIPSKDGKSHCPEELSEFEHICLGAEILASTIVEMDREETQ
jgi:hydantoinase/carbamoylase family amidase